ncbi:hypothetical protein HMPREF0758_0973 [Serratia odorifera DSM 4582]|uniref:Uncharacterized protein n=1 Tax=Serratia odorifera DSM 4582 TaxID=667129 RepID=D4DYH3_SEROD|nr:hypothetical protein HMPREF0758_0973 [Serratia odorifera DSM 4582]
MPMHHRRVYRGGFYFSSVSLICNATFLPSPYGLLDACRASA